MKNFDQFEKLVNINESEVSVNININEENYKIINDTPKGISIAKNYDSSYGTPLDLPKDFYLNGEKYIGKAIFVKKGLKTDDDFYVHKWGGYLMTPSIDGGLDQNNYGNEYLTDKDGYGIRSLSRRGMIIMIDNNGAKIY